MKLTKNQLKKIEKYAFQNAEEEGMAHDIDHIKSVTNWAIYLARKEKANVKVCKIAGLLHDIALKKYSRKNHEQKSARMAKEFLSKMKLDHNFINQVVHAIECHGSKFVKNAKTEEAKIIYDADKTQVVLIKGFCRLYEERLRKGLTMDENLEECEEIYNRLYQLIQTITAKKILKPPYQIMQQFFKEYKKWK